MKRYINFDDGARTLLFILLIIQFLFSNGIYLVAGGLCFGIIIYYLQQPFKPAVFSIIFLYHFIQVAAAVWLSNYVGKDINFRSFNTETAIISGYIGLVVLFIPIIYYHNKIPSISLDILRKHAYRLSIEKTFYTYLVGFFAINSLGGVAFLFSGLTQIIISLVKIKWFLYLLFGLQVFMKKQKVKEFLFFTGFEFMTGFYSYFSDFKTVLFYFSFLALVFLVEITLKQLFLAILAGIAVFYGMAFFQGIKGEYRGYLNQGTSSQVVSVSKDDALNKLVELTKSQKEGTMEASIESFLDRFQYTFHLAKAMEIVPAKIPFQNGANWGESLEYSLTPRFLNPDKPNFEASVKTSKYTGIRYSGAKQGVSFSLGYFADSYVDFGFIGMYIPIFLIGLLLGITYYYFVRKSSDNFVFNFAVVGAMYMEFFAFEMDSTYLAGRLFASLLTFFTLRFLFFPWLIKYLTIKQEKEGISYFLVQ